MQAQGRKGLMITGIQITNVHGIVNLTGIATWEYVTIVKRLL